jgi:hypothetical protein
MTKFTRIQRKRIIGWKMPENTIYVGRGSRWGNPFVVGRDGDVNECIEKYKNLMFPYTHKEGNLVKFYVSAANLNDIKTHLRGKNLACWCPIDKPCHADFLLEIANE